MKRTGLCLLFNAKAQQVNFLFSKKALLFAISASPSLQNFCGVSEIPEITKKEVLEICVIPFS